MHSYTKYIGAKRYLGVNGCVDHDLLQADIAKIVVSKEPGFLSFTCLHRGQNT